MFYRARNHRVGETRCDAGDDELRSSERFPVRSALAVRQVLCCEVTFCGFENAELDGDADADA